MPTTIQTKRGDSDYLATHLLDDGELAIVRKWLIDGGPQDGEYTYFWGLRYGDGTENGGQDGITAVLAAGMTNALVQASNAVRYSTTFNKDGQYQPQYLKWWNDLASATTDYITCVAPEPVSSNFHLGTGNLLYNGDVIDWKVSEQFKFLTDCTWDSGSWDYYHAALDRITSYDANELTGDSTNVDLIGIRESIQQQVATTYYTNATFIGIQSSIWNDVSGTAMPVGIGFDSEYGYYRDSSDHGINRRVETFINYNVSTLENSYVGATEYVGDWIGLNIEDQTAGSFDGTFAGVRIGSIQSVATSPIYGMLIGDIGETTLAPLTVALKTGDISANVTDGTAHGIDIDNLYGETVRGLRINNAGSTASDRAEGISITNIGSTITTGTSTAIGMSITVIGSDGCSVAIGFKNTDITSSDTAYGIYISNVEGDLKSRGIQLTNIGTVDSTVNDGIYLEHVGVTSTDALATNTGLSIYQIGVSTTFRSHAVRAGIIGSNTTDGTSIGYEVSSIDGNVARGVQIYTVGGTSTTESRGVVVNSIGTTSTESTAVATGYYADTIGNSSGGCVYAHGLLIDNVLSDGTSHGVEIANVNGDTQARGVMIWNVGDTASLWNQGYAANEVGVNSTNVSARCLGVFIGTVGDVDNGMLSCIMKGSNCYSDGTAHGISMDYIYGGDDCRGISIGNVDGIDASVNYGISIAQIGYTNSTNAAAEASGLYLGLIGKASVTAISTGMKIGTIDGDGTASGFETSSIIAPISNGCIFYNIGDAASTQAIGFNGVNIGAAATTANAIAYGMYVNVLGNRTKGLLSAGLRAYSIVSQAEASGVYFDNINADTASGFYAGTIGPSSPDASSRYAYGINIANIGTSLSKVTSEAYGMYVDAIGGSGAFRSYGLRIDSITTGVASGIAYGINFNSISSIYQNIGIGISSVDNEDAYLNSGIRLVNIGISSKETTAHSHGIYVDNVGRDKVGATDPGNLLSWGGLFQDIHADGTSIGLSVNGVIGTINGIGVNIDNVDANSDGTSVAIHGLHIGTLGSTVTDSDLISAITVNDDIGNTVVTADTSATSSYSYLINASTANVLNSEYAYGIHLYGLDGTYASGFEIDHIGEDTSFTAQEAYGMRIKNIHGHTDVVGIAIDSLHGDQARTVAGTKVVGLYVGDVQAGAATSNRGYAIHTNDTNYPGVTCLYLPTGDGASPPTTYDVGTLFVDATGQVWATIA